MQSSQARVLVPFAIVTLIWGSTWIVIRDQLGGAGVPASWSVAYRFLVGGGALAAVAAWRRERLAHGGIALALLIGALQFVGNFNFVYRAEAHITSGLVAVLFALLLVPNALLARVFLGQKLGAQLLAGSAVAMAGTALLMVQEARADPNGAGETWLGTWLTLGAIGCASCSNVLMATKRAGAQSPVALLAAAMLTGAAFNAVLALATVGAPQFDPRAGYVAGIVYLGLIGSAVAFVLYFGLIRTIGPAKAAYNSVLVPVIAMLLSTALEGYRWTPLAVAGAALVLAGLVIALTARRPAR